MSLAIITFCPIIDLLSCLALHQDMQFTATIIDNYRFLSLEVSTARSRRYRRSIKSILIDSIRPSRDTFNWRRRTKRIIKICQLFPSCEGGLPLFVSITLATRFYIQNEKISEHFKIIEQASDVYEADKKLSGNLFKLYLFNIFTLYASRFRSQIAT